MIDKFLSQNEGDLQETLDRIEEYQEIEDDSILHFFKLFRENINIISKIKLNYSSFDQIIVIPDDQESRFFSINNI